MKNKFLSALQTLDYNEFVKPEQKSLLLNLLLAASGLSWASGAYFGHWPTDFMNNFFCFDYIGCNAGFFGYDFLVHFLSGTATAIFVIWLGDEFPKFSVRFKNRLKTAIVLLALVALVGVCWEFIEFFYDQSKGFLVSNNIPTLNIHAQPSNADTMGDLFADIAGGAIPAFAFAFSNILLFKRKRLKV